MITKKTRRHSGYVTPDATVSFKDMKRFDLFIGSFYDDWKDYRDGMRDRYSDFKKIKSIYYRWKSSYVRDELFERRLKMNKKQKMLLRRRVAKMAMRRIRAGWRVQS